jgi:chromosome segregation ATPase
LLLKEINGLKKQKSDLEELCLNKSVELSFKRESNHHQDAHLGLVVEQLRRDNVQLRNELNEARAQLITRDNLIKELHNQLNENKSSNELREKCAQLSKENSRLSASLELSLKQNEADLIMAKKNADLSKQSIEKIQLEIDNEKSLNQVFKTQIDQFKLQERLEAKNQAGLKKRIGDLETELNDYHVRKEASVKRAQNEAKERELELSEELNKLSLSYNSILSTHKNVEQKYNEVKDALGKLEISSKLQIEQLKSKVLYLNQEIDMHKQHVQNEKNTAKQLQSKLESLTRQESIHLNLIASLKLRISELETQLGLAQESNLKHDLLEDENRKLKSELEILSLKIAEIDRLKQLEDLVNSQRWGELGQLAESMKNLSKTMTTNTSTSSSVQII